MDNNLYDTPGRINPDLCKSCDKYPTKEGHDACLGELPGVANACCGHGTARAAYVQFDHDNYADLPNQQRLGGQVALNIMKLLKEANHGQ